MCKILKYLLIVSVAAFLAGCFNNGNNEANSGLYKNDEARSLAYESYDRTMELWPVAFQEDWVETEYGTSHIIIAGPESGSPIFLFPGLFADATMWYANVGELSKKYRVYCPDQITYGGKSTPSEKPVEDILGYSAWFQTLLDHYGYNQAAVAGLSYGSWLGLALAREIPEKISAVIMLDPSETFIKMDGGIAWKGFWNFMFFPNRDKYRNFFDWMGGGYNDPKSDIWVEHMLDVIEHGSVGMFDIPQHRIYKAEELLNVTMPVLIMAGGKPIVYKDPRVFAAAASTALPHAEVEIVPGTGHSLHVQKPEVVNARMMRFLDENYR